MLTEAEANRLTQRIQLRLGTIADNAEAVLPMIEEARAGDVHEVLGYRGWTEYVADKFGGTLARLGKAERLPFVELLSEQGMSTRAIASVVGTSHQTVANDLNTAPVKNLTPAEPESPQRPLSAKVAAIREAHRPTTGLDGKTYSKPEPKPRRRRPPLPDAYWRAMYDLEKSVERLERLHDDDRFRVNQRDLSERNFNRLSSLGVRLTELGRHLCGADDQLGEHQGRGRAKYLPGGDPDD